MFLLLIQKPTKRGLESLRMSSIFHLQKYWRNYSKQETIINHVKESQTNGIWVYSTMENVTISIYNIPSQNGFKKLTVSNENSILESLDMSRQTEIKLKAVVRGDIIALRYDFEGFERKFQLQFLNDADCQMCIQILSKFIVYKTLPLMNIVEPSFSQQAHTNSIRESQVPSIYRISRNDSLLDYSQSQTNNSCPPKCNIEAVESTNNSKEADNINLSKEPEKSTNTMEHLISISNEEFEKLLLNTLTNTQFQKVLERMDALIKSKLP